MKPELCSGDQRQKFDVISWVYPAVKHAILQVEQILFVTSKNSCLFKKEGAFLNSKFSLYKSSFCLFVLLAYICSNVALKYFSNMPVHEYQQGSYGV